MLKRLLYAAIAAAVVLVCGITFAGAQNVACQPWTAGQVFSGKAWGEPLRWDVTAVSNGEVRSQLHFFGDPNRSMHSRAGMTLWEPWFIKRRVRQGTSFAIVLKGGYLSGVCISEGRLYAFLYLNDSNAGTWLTGPDDLPGLVAQSGYQYLQH